MSAESMIGIEKNSAQDSEHTEVRPYDFVHPDKLSRSNLRALQMVFSSLEKSWQHTLSSSLREEVNVEVGSVKQTRFVELVGVLSQPYVTFALRLGQLPGHMLTYMPTDFALSVVDRLAGGKGEVPEELHALSEIERAVVRVMIRRLASDLSQAWSPVADLPAFVEESFDLSSDSDIDPEELMVSAEIKLTMNSLATSLTLMVPVNMLTPILKDLDPIRWAMREGHPGNEGIPSLVEMVKDLDVSLSVELGHASLTMQDVLGMEIGDVVRLDTNVNDPLPLKIGGRVQFYVRPGLRGNRLSVQITGETLSDISKVDSAPIEEAA